MALTAGEIKQNYPLPVYNYKVEIGGVAIAFTEVAGLSIAYETYTYKESNTDQKAPGPRVLHMPSQATATNITLKKGVIRAQSVATFYTWIAGIQINQVEKKDIYVRLCDEKGEAVISWKVINAFPTKLDAPTFDANSNDAAIESMELRADAIFIEEA
ncbi:MAG: phage tail protein [Oscillochloris sp.]|nr:phage tail protein [Oscillochloris sp.]